MNFFFLLANYFQPLNISDVTVYHKICPRCQTQYRYQEWSHGIHNYNDSLLIGLDVCLFIRAGLLVSKN